MAKYNTAEVCYHGSNSCCRWSSNIKVKNCSSFFVYELQRTPACSRYCGNAGAGKFIWCFCLKDPLSLTVMHHGRFVFSGVAMANKSVSIGKAVVCFGAHLVSKGRLFVWLSVWGVIILCYDQWWRDLAFVESCQQYLKERPPWNECRFKLSL